MHIIDSARRPHLCSHLQTELGPGMPKPATQRALADHMATVVPVTSPAETSHQMADCMCHAASRPVDYTAEGAFATLATHAQALLANRPADLDLLVLDELQDLRPEWEQALTQRDKPEGRLI